MAADETNQKATRKTNDVGPTGQTVAGNLARLRGQRGLSTYRLSELLADLGRPIAPSAISRIESGHRKLDVDDLIAFAVALRVSPTGLLLPPTSEATDTVSITAAGDYAADTAWSWLLGIAPLSLPEDDDGEAFMDFQTHSRPRGRRNYWKLVKGDDLNHEQILAQVREQLARDSDLPTTPPAESADFRTRGASPTDGTGQSPAE